MLNEQRTWHRVIGCGLLLSGLWLQACGDDDDNVDSGLDGGPDSGSAGHSSGSGGNGTGSPKDAGPDSSVVPRTDSGTTPPPPPVVCGSTTCPAAAAQAAMLGVTACCQDNGDCGVQTPLAPGCLPAGAPGGIDTSCPEFDIMGLITWYGCCTPDGQCGALDTSDGGVGCVVNASLMQPEQSCSYDPANTCDRLLEVQCDGAEDCKSGQKCCGDYDSGYRKFVCADDCAAEQTAQGGMWAEACHPDETCTMAGFTCLANTDYLPDYLYRCKDTGTAPVNAGSTKKGEINCGDSVCGSGTKCCISIPSLAKCVDKDTDCACNSGNDGDAGAEDAGN